MLAFISFLLAFFTLPTGLSLDDQIELSEDVVYYGAEIVDEVNVEEDFELTFYFGASELERDVQVFVHLESEETECRLVRDVRPQIEEDGIIRSVRFQLPSLENSECSSQRMEVFVGLYHTDGGLRLHVKDPLSGDNRIHAGHFHIRNRGAKESTSLFAPKHIFQNRILSIIRPWKGWAFGIFLGILASGFLWRTRKRFFDENKFFTDVSSRKTRLFWIGIPFAIISVIFIANILVALEFIKDDAYITFRIAHNFVNGDGLVFNTGDRLEGMTTFLWVFIVAPFEKLGWDLFQVFAVVGTLFGIGAIFTTIQVAIDVNGTEKHLSHLWAALWLATSSSMAQWTTSGMEQPLAVFLPILAFLLTFRALEQNHKKLALSGGIIMGLAALTRPEIHLIGMILGVPILWRSIKNRRLDPVSLFWLVGLLGTTAPAHLFRFLYYGELLPNTFFVKTGGSWVVILAGIRKLYDMFAFNNLGWIVLLTPFAFIDGKNTSKKAILAAVSLGFMGYIVKVGADEMRWHRLYLPALPFLLSLAAMGARNIVQSASEILSAKQKHLKWLPATLAIAGLGWTTQNNARFTYDEFNGFNGWAELNGNYHPDMGKFIVRHEQTGGLAAFQDMGSTPYHAPDINWLDFIGLVDGTIAHARHDYGLHAFVGAESASNKPAFDAEMRAYFYERNPEWAFLTSYVHGSHDIVARRFAENPTPEAIGAPVSSNGYQFGIYDEHFREQYVHVRTWPRSASYYLSLFRRRDLWDQTPREVVFENPPQNINGPTGRWDHNLAMLGAEIESEAIEGQEFFLTTWWQVEGPAEPDTFIFVHIENEDDRLPLDHIPGDWMYPADRWQNGDIIEDRVLIQLSSNLSPGTYDIYIGLYRRSTGERWRILEGENHDANRMHIGQVNIRAWRPFLDQLIEPPNVEQQRIHPERITPHGRNLHE